LADGTLFENTSTHLFRFKKECRELDELALGLGLDAACRSTSNVDIAPINSYARAKYWLCFRDIGYLSYCLLKEISR